jgi:1,2-dihydroxy-3-keto-5-methylthiopentene dioxygenase
MSKLAFYTQFNLQQPYRISDDALICTETLAQFGIRFEQWRNLSVLPGLSMQDEDIISLYSDQVERVKSELGYTCVDIATMKPDDAFSISLRGRYLSEHTHDEDEVRFFLSGNVLVYLHINQKIHILECTRGDFIVIPAGIKHWMDIGPKPEFSVIRWFNSKNAFKNHFTEGYVAEATPRWETIYSETRFRT